MPTEDMAYTRERLDRRVAESNSNDLKRAIRAAIRRQADAWGIRFDQAQALLLDRRSVA